MIQLSLLLAALDGSTALWWIDVIFKVAIGLGAVIFVHELGHFLVAKACGVKVEKFMIGFDIGGYKISWRRGETEYGIGILPLGGYVKMLGQDDDPSHIAEQMQKSQINPASGDAVPITGPNGEKYFIDRRSYLAKSVPQRMAIISAGVIMNVIFAFIFATIAYGMGVSYLPCIISEAVPGSPAWEAGLEPGDEIIQLGDQVNPTFTELRGDVTLGDRDAGIRCVVRRAADGQEIERVLKPERGRGLAKIGVAPPLTVTLLAEMAARPGTAAAESKFVRLSGEASDLTAIAGNIAFQGGGRIVRVGDTPISNYREWVAELARRPDEPLQITIERTLATKTAAESEHSQTPEAKLEATFEVPVQSMRAFGLIMDMGAIAGVQAGSPAEDAGLKAGDLIDSVDGETIAEGSPTSEGWNPETLPEYFRLAANEGRDVELQIRRPVGDGASEAEFETATITIKPHQATVFHSLLPPDAPLAVPAAGFAYEIESTVHAVVPSGPAAAAGIRAGDKVVQAKFIYPKDEEGNSQPPETIKFDAKRSSWPAVATNLQLTPEGTFVEFSIERPNGTELQHVQVKPTAVDGQFVADRGFVFEPIMRTREASSFSEQVRRGWEETADALTMVFRFLKKLGTDVPLSALGGPVTIAKAAGYSAAEGVSSLLIFLTMLSANLAVINFLPIPLLDGGHIVFLAYEWIRGRPANERFVIALHTAGFVLIVTLMLYVLALDFNLIERNL
jgi:regulator of sigma E protease